MVGLRDVRHGIGRRRAAAALLRQRRQHDRRGEMEFIHVNKTAGSSIEAALGLPFSHYTASMRVARLGIEEWNLRYSFTFVRNPWDRLVSQYHHRKGLDRLRTDLDFRDWVRATLVQADRGVVHQPQMFTEQLDWISGSSGEVLVDDIYRYESLHEDFARLCQRLGIQASLPHRKSSAHRHYSQYYDAATEKIVRDAFGRDVEFFDYQFDRCTYDA